MKKYLVRVFTIFGIIILSFFINKLNVKADGFNEAILCEYALPIDYSLGVVEKKLSNEVIITYDGTNDGYELKISSTFDEIAKNKSFKDNGFHKYIIGKKNGTKENRGKEYRTCPSYVRFNIAGPNYMLDPVTFSTYKMGVNQTDMSSDDFMIGAGMYDTQGVKIKNNDFAVTKGVDYLIGLTPIKEEATPYYLYLKNQRIDGKDANSKATAAIKSYFKHIYGFADDGSTTVSSSKTLSISNDTVKIKPKLNPGGPNALSVEMISLKKDYINISNYSFKDYDSFKKYALSSFTSVKREDADKNITQDEWVDRQIIFYYIDNYKRLMYYLQKTSPYKNIYPADYKDSAYRTIIYLINISSNKNTEKDNQNLSDRTKSDEAADKNICVEVCSDSTGVIYSGTALNQCQASSLYKKCTDCVNRCNGVPGGEHERCMNTCYGTDEYKELVEKKQKNKEELEKLNDKLYNVSAPKLNINVNYKYVPDCKDYKEFHVIYVILRVIAPFLVILLGSLDYLQAITASDAEKMDKARKQFPKRLILLVLFILVPFIVSLITNTFSVSNTTVARCIVNGK